MTDISVNIEAPDRYLLRTTRRIGMLSYKSAKVRFDHRTTVQGINLPSEFIVEDEEGVVNYKQFSQFYLADGNQSITLASDIFADIIEGQENGRARISIKAGEYYYNISTGAWVETATEIVNEISLDFVGPGSVTAGTFLWVASMNVNTANIPDGAGDEIVLRFRRSLSDTEYAPLTRFTNNVFELKNPAVEQGQNTAIDYMLTQQSAARGRYDDGSIWFSDGPTAYARSAITRDAAGAELTSEWRFADEQTAIVHANILLREVMDMKRSEVRGLTADLLGEYKPCKMPNVDDSFHFFIGGSQNGKNNRWNANLFRLNRRKDDEIISTGEFITTNNQGNDKIQYFDNQGQLVFERQEAFSSGTSWFNPEWINDDAILASRAQGRFRFDFDRATGDYTMSTLEQGISSGAVIELDLDEDGNIYSTHNTNINTLVKIDLEGNVLATMDAQAHRKIYVDGEYVYTTNYSQRRYYRRNKSDLTLIESSDQFTQDFRDKDIDLFYPDRIIRMFTAFDGVDNSIVQLNKSNFAIVKTIFPATFGRGVFRRMDYDENGMIYVITSQWLLKFDPDLNLIAEYDMELPDARKIAVSTQPFNELFIRYEATSGAPVRVFDRETLAFKHQYSTSGPAEETRRTMAAHPGRAAIKFKVLGLTKQY